MGKSIGTQISEKSTGSRRSKRSTRSTKTSTSAKTGKTLISDGTIDTKKLMKKYEEENREEEKYENREEELKDNRAEVADEAQREEKNRINGLITGEEAMQKSHNLFSSPSLASSHSDIRYKIENPSLDDSTDTVICCSKLPDYCKLSEDATYSIDEDAPRYGTEEEYFFHKMSLSFRKKQRKKETV